MRLGRGTWLAAAQNQTNYIEAMKIRNGGLLTVHLGRFKERTIRDCRRCGQGYTCGCDRPYKSYEEKETDVALGAMMVADVALRVADITLPISADTDLYPALVAARRVNPDQRIYLGMPPGNTKPPNRLTSIGGVGWFFIREQALRSAQLTNIVTDPATGRSHNRPAKWI